MTTSPSKSAPVIPIASSRSAEYNRYRESVRWQKIRRAVSIRAKGKCEICYRQDGAECAHLTYERFGNERLTDLLWVCRTCHESLDFEEASEVWMK